MKRKPTETRAPLFTTVTTKPEPRFGIGAYVLANGEMAMVKIIEWLPTVGWIYYLTEKLKSYRLSVFSEREFVSFGARLEKAAA